MLPTNTTEVILLVQLPYSGAEFALDRLPFHWWNPDDCHYHLVNLAINQGDLLPKKLRDHGCDNTVNGRNPAPVIIPFPECFIYTSQVLQDFFCQLYFSEKDIIPKDLFGFDVDFRSN